MSSTPAKPESLPEVQLTHNAKIVLEKRYLRKGPDNKPNETPEDFLWRVASSIAAEETKYERSSYSAEKLAKEFYQLMASLTFLPNSPTLMNAGTPLGQLAACFVLPVGDSIEEIFDAVKYAALIHKSGGGTGFSFSRLRPKDSRVGSTGGVASGPISFLRIFNTATEQIKQGGTRRGANMGILSINHPDILEFIRIKECEGELNNFNLSVAVTNDFMRAVEERQDYDLIDPHTNSIAGQLNAGEVFDLLVQKAWTSGDPGVIFIDRINEYNATPAQGQIESTNPCGEQPLLPYEACNLGSVNLAAFYDENNPDCLDWDRLAATVALAVRFLDNVIDASIYPLEKIKEIVHKNRKIGLGVMGFADLLFRTGRPYNSRQATELAEKIMSFFSDEARKTSALLAKERGPFPAYQESVFAAKGEGPYRNATVTTIAPTGTLSIIAGCSSGIEPLFALCFSRNVLDGAKLMEVNPWFEQALKNSDFYSAGLMEEVATTGGIQHMDMLPEELRKVFITAMDIDPEWHLRMQAAFQHHTDNAVSKTVNLPNPATEEDIRRIYWMAYEMGCKGVTVYRDGCKSTQVLCTGTQEEKQKDQTYAWAKTRTVRERPDVVTGFTQKVNTGLGTLYLTINELDGRPFELFATIGKSGRSITAKAEAIGRLVSLAMRSGVNVEEIVKQLKGIGGEHPVFQKKGLLLSIPDAIAWVLGNRYLKNKNDAQEVSLSKKLCLDCGASLIFQEGCYICRECGYTKCG